MTKKKAPEVKAEPENISEVEKGTSYTESAKCYDVSISDIVFFRLATQEANVRYNERSI